MGDYGFHGGHVDATSINGAAGGEIALTGGGEWTIQAALYTKSTDHIHFKIERTSGLAAPIVLSVSEGFLTHGGSTTFRLSPATHYLYWWITTSAGNLDAGGADDYILKSCQRH
jgi:hypothetical protein